MPGSGTPAGPRVERGWKTRRRKRRVPEAMGYDEKTAGRVRSILSRRQDVVERKMVGGLSFMVNGSMCCGLTSTGLMVCVGRDAYERTLAQPHVRPMRFAGRPLAGFVCVDPGGYRTDAALANWVQRGVDFVSTLSANKSVDAKRVDAPRRDLRRSGLRAPADNRRKE
jgi:TfoX N-terminal domain